MNDTDLRQTMMEMLDYDPTTGIFTWKVKRPGRFPGIGMPAGAVMAGGYIIIGIMGKPYYAHQLAWLWVYGILLKHLDHKDTVKTNNAISNLRPSDKSKNGMNRGLQKNNSSGFKGVCYNARDDEWMAYIHIDKKRKYLGRHGCPTIAALTYDQAARIHHGEFARLNFPETS